MYVQKQFLFLLVITCKVYQSLFVFEILQLICDEILSEFEAVDFDDFLVSFVWIHLLTFVSFCVHLYCPLLTPILVK